jgi:hypothetical protein
MAQASVPVLNYAGITIPQRPAFNARRAWAWKGDHLFRVYLTQTHLFLIRIGGARNNAVAHQGGLLGMLIAHYMNKAAKKKEQKRVLENENKPLEQMMAEHKRNHVIAVADISDPAIEKGGFWSAGQTKLTFNLSSEKKRVQCVLESVDDVRDALRTLPGLLPHLRVAVQFNEKKKRFDKLKA